MSKVKNFREWVLDNSYIKKIIKELNLNENQIDSGIFIFEQIIFEQEEIEKGKNLDFITRPFIYNENYISAEMIPNGELKQRLIKEKYHKLGDITKFNYDIKIDRNFNDENIKNDTFNWKINDGKRNFLFEWYKNFVSSNETKKENQKGFYLKGSLGSGKSMFMQGFANNVLKSKKTFAYINLNDLNQKLKSLFENNKEFDKVINELKTVNYLFIDDIGNEKQSEWSLFNVLYPVLDHRVQNNQFNAFTSNLDYDELEKLFSKVPNIDTLKIERLMDRIKCSTDLIYVNGENLRIAFSYPKKEKYDVNVMAKQKQRSM